MHISPPPPYPRCGAGSSLVREPRCVGQEEAGREDRVEGMLGPGLALLAGRAWAKGRGPSG